jgi:hypothetical protein
LSLEEIDAELAKLSQESKDNDLDWLASAESKKPPVKQKEITKNAKIEPQGSDFGQMSSGDVINLR